MNKIKICSHCGCEINGDVYNGVLYNDMTIKKHEKLPKTKIKTDSYVAVQLLEKYNQLNFDTIAKMSEMVRGSFVFTVLYSDNKLYISKGDNPLCLLHFKELGLYLYTSTKAIMQEVIKGSFLEKQKAEVITIDEGEIISIDKNGKLERNQFRFYDDVLGGYLHYSNWYEDDDKQESYLLDYCNMFGISEDELIMLYEMGYDDEEIELMLMDHDMLRSCINEARAYICRGFRVAGWIHCNTKHPHFHLLLDTCNAADGKQYSQSISDLSDFKSYISTQLLGYGLNEEILTEVRNITEEQLFEDETTDSTDEYDDSYGDDYSEDDYYDDYTLESRERFLDKINQWNFGTAEPHFPNPSDKTMCVSVNNSVPEYPRLAKILSGETTDESSIPKEGRIMCRLRDPKELRVMCRLVTSGDKREMCRSIDKK